MRNPLSSDIQAAVDHLRDGDHLAFAYSNEPQLKPAIVMFVRRGIGDNKINYFLVTKAEAEKYIAYLKESGIEVDKLIAEEELIIEHIDELLQQKNISLVTSVVKRRLEALSNLARSKGKRGLNIGRDSWQLG